MPQHLPTFFALAAIALTAGCRNLPPSKPDAMLTPPERTGQRVFAANCASCHYPNTTRPLHGPGLQALLKEPYLPSGAPADDDHVRAVILHGRGFMPAMDKALGHSPEADDQMDELLAYLHTI